MAFRPGKRKEVKKQSYYVWFLGAKESKGLRGEEYIRPVLHYLLDKEKELEPMKVTLQISNKGLKIIQNVPRKSNRGKTEQIKHFIPHHAITCALQESKPNDDIVCCILLIYNPLTKCPVHVHAYRCDSVETANTLRSQLQILIDRAENQKKFREIENRLVSKGLLESRRLNSDGRSTRTDGSDRTEDSFGSDRDAPAYGPKDQHIAGLYDSLASELRERLGNRNSCPILLPPKDYDTISRKRGQLQGIDQRRSTNQNLVGKTPIVPVQTKSSVRHKESGSSGKSSSGIGSDEALSSAIQEVSLHFKNKVVNPETSSDEEEWPASDVLTEDRSKRIGRQKPSPINTSVSTQRSSPPSSERPSPPTYLFGQREPIPLGEQVRKLSTKSGVSNRSVDVEPTKGKDREAQVVYRRRSNPLDGKVSREHRPVSYPSQHTKEHYRNSANLRPYSGDVNLKDQEKPGSHDSGSYLSRDQHVSRRNVSPQAYIDRRRSEYYPPPERTPSYHQHPDERRKSAYFDLPVHNRDYRHSFAEPVSRRIPMGTQY